MFCGTKAETSVCLQPDITVFVTIHLTSTETISQADKLVFTTDTSL